MERGKATISHDQDYESLLCINCKREFILLNIIRNTAGDASIIEQQQCDFCPFCGAKQPQ